MGSNTETIEDFKLTIEEKAPDQNGREVRSIQVCFDVRATRDSMVSRGLSRSYGQLMKTQKLEKRFRNEVEEAMKELAIAREKSERCLGDIEDAVSVDQTIANEETKLREQLKREEDFMQQLSETAEAVERQRAAMLTFRATGNENVVKAVPDSTGSHLGSLISRLMWSRPSASSDQSSSSDDGTEKLYRSFAIEIGRLTESCAHLKSQIAERELQRQPLRGDIAFATTNFERSLECVRLHEEIVQAKECELESIKVLLQSQLQEYDLWQRKRAKEEQWIKLAALRAVADFANDKWKRAIGGHSITTTTTTTSEADSAEAEGGEDEVRGEAEQVTGEADGVRGEGDHVEAEGDEVKAEGDEVRGEDDGGKGDEVRGEEDGDRIADPPRECIPSI